MPQNSLSWEEEARIPGTLANKIMNNIMMDNAINAAARLQIFIERIVKEQQEQTKEKEAMVLQQREKAKEEDKELRHEEFQRFKEQMDKQLEAAKGSTEGLYDLKDEITKQIADLTNDNVSLDKNIAEIDSDLKRITDELNNNPDRKTKIDKIKNDVKASAKTKQFKIYNANGEEALIKPQEIDRVIDTLIDKANKPFSADLPRLNPGHIRQVKEALDHEEQHKQKGRVIKPEQSVAAALSNQQSMLGSLEALFKLGHAQGYKDMQPSQLLQLLKHNQNANGMFLKVQQSFAGPDRDKVKELYSVAHEGLKHVDAKELNDAKLEYLKSKERHLLRTLPPRNKPR